MVNIPNRLLKTSAVQIYYHDEQITILEKSITEAVVQRPSYLTRHAISFILSGEQRLETEQGEIIKLSANDIVFLRQGIYTVTDILAKNNTFSSFHIFIHDRLLQQLLGQFDIEYQKSEQSIFSLSAPSYASNYITSIRLLSEQLVQFSIVLAQAKITELLAALLANDPSGQTRKWYTQWRDLESKNLSNFMNLHFDKAFSVADYAYLTGRSIATFRREFKLKFGTSPRKWITQKRMKKAQELLQQDVFTLPQIANAVGYGSVSYFVQTYKKVYGETPRADSVSNMNF